MKNAFYELISGLDTAKERIIEPEDTSVETSHWKAKRKKGMKDKTRAEYPQTVGQLQKIEHPYSGNARGRRKTREQKKELK